MASESNAGLLLGAVTLLGAAVVAVPVTKDEGATLVTTGGGALAAVTSNSARRCPPARNAANARTSAGTSSAADSSCSACPNRGTTSPRSTRSGFASPTTSTGEVESHMIFNLTYD